MKSFIEPKNEEFSNEKGDFANISKFKFFNNQDNYSSENFDMISQNSSKKK